MFELILEEYYDPAGSHFTYFGTELIPSRSMKSQISVI